MSVPAASLNDTTANVVVSPPAGAPTGGWVNYELTLCTPGGCAAAPVAGDCLAFPSASSTCSLAGLLPATEYTIQAVAVNGTVRSQTGSATFTTLYS